MNISQMTVDDIQTMLKKSGSLLSEDLREAIGQDSRLSVKKLYRRFCRREALDAKEYLRLENMHLYEKDAMNNGFGIIAGVDEAGRGPLAGPVIASAVVLPEHVRIQGLNDSKKLSPGKRSELFDEIREVAVCWSVGISSVEEIESINILQASLLAMRRAVQNLPQLPDYLLVDAVSIPGVKMPQMPIVKGDGKSASIAAASVIAKVTRDRILTDYDREYPEYGFAAHKGYGTSEHIKAIRKHGICRLHRASFCKNLGADKETDGSLWQVTK